MPSVNPGPAITSTPNTDAVMSPVNTLSNPVVQGSNALRLLAVVRGANVNALGDIPMPVINAAGWVAATVVLANASISLTTASFGVFTAPAGGGTAIRAAATATALTGPTVVSAAAAANVVTQFNVQTLYLNVGIAQGAPATVDAFIYGYDLS